MLQRLFLLILMGECSFCLGRLYRYHFVQEKKSWEEARTYCRKNYTDLATVYDMEDVKTLRDLLMSEREAWIGLRKQTNANRTWHWSLPGVKFNRSKTNWKQGGEVKDEPNDCVSPENCVGIEKCKSIEKRKWLDFTCTGTNSFICYNETMSKRFHLIHEKVPWLEAQRYCRANHTDLVSGLEQLNDPDFTNEHEAACKSTEYRATFQSTKDQYLWIGLFRDTWTWSDEKDFSFRNWDQIREQDRDGKHECATVSPGYWSSKNCSETHPFLCYKDHVILIKKNKTWEEALYYCREHHQELVSVTEPHQQAWVQETARLADTPFVWMGLRYTCTLGFWFWLTDEAVRYKNWTPGTQEDDCDMSGAMETEGGHKWFKKSARMEFNFICLRR